MRTTRRILFRTPSLASAVALLAAGPIATHGQAGPTATSAASARDLPLTAAARQRFVGVYSVAAPGQRAASLRVYEADGMLMGQMNDNAPTRLLFQGGDAFRPEQAPAFLVTFTVVDGRATRVAMRSPEGRMEGARVEDAAGAITAADPSTSGALFDELARMDSTLFDAAYVTCDAGKVAALMVDDVEFYHDRTGLQTGQQVRDAFGRLTQQCPRGQGVTREVVAGSVRVYPIAGYGAVQMGEHRFVERGAATMTVARFVHVWRRQDGAWKLARVLSFDHQPVPR